ncbi:hypothetical protein CWS02_13960 [Enterobacter sp. EA-1]|nr:hypothetical protein CWS02_13960 [Enterobacter sp. EA-1]
MLAQPEGSDAAMLMRAQQVMQALSELVNTPVVLALLPGNMGEKLDSLLNQGRMIVGALNGLLAGDSARRFEDYLAQILTISDAIAPELLAPLRAGTASQEYCCFITGERLSCVARTGNAGCGAELVAADADAPAVSRNRVAPPA